MCACVFNKLFSEKVKKVRYGMQNTFPSWVMKQVLEKNCTWQMRLVIILQFLVAGFHLNHDESL